MNNLRNAVSHALALIVIATLTSSCSAEAKKARAAKRAEEFFKAADYDKAKIEYTNVLRADPKDPTGFERIGIMWLEEGAPLRAGPFFMRAKELAPARVSVRVKLGETMIAVGGLAEARQEALEALKIEPGNEMAILILADAARTPEEIAETEECLKQSKQRDGMNYHLAVGTLALRKNDLPGLDAALQKSVAADPKASKPHLALARFRLVMKRNDEAREEFKKATEFAALRDSAHLLWSEFLAQMNQRDEAVSYLREVVRKAPDFLPAWTLLAKYASQKPDYDEALKLLENVFRRDAQNFDARMLESEFHMARNDPKKAIEVMKQLETNYPKIPIIKYQLARAYLQTGDPIQASTALEQAIAAAPTYGDAVLLLAEINLRNGNAAPVVGAMEGLLKDNPDLDRAQVMQADAYRLLGRFDDAEAILRKRIAATPTKPDPYVMLGVLLRQQNKLPAAREMIDKALSLAPGNLSIINQLIDLDILANDFPTALQRISSQLEKTPDSAGLYLLRGKIYANQRDWDNAEAALQKVLELNADIPAAYELLVSVYVSAKKLPQAIAQLESFIGRNPNNPGGLMTLALLYTEAKDHEKARATYEKLLVLRPEASMAMNNLAYIYSDQLNDLEKARDWAAKARNIEPGNAAIGDTFGWVLYRLGDYKQAATVLKDSAEKMADEPEVQFHWGMASYMMGDSQAARTGLEAALRSPKDFSGKDEATKRLAMLNGTAGEQAGVDLPQLEAMLKQNPNDPVTLGNLGDAYRAQGMFPKAAEAYEQAIKINPTLAKPTLQLAQLYAGPLKNKQRALELGKKARELAPGDSRSTATLGKLAFEAGNYSWAYSLLQESSRQLSSDAGVLKDFAWAAYSMGKVSDARQTMERAVKAAADGSDSADAKAFLALTAPEEAGDGTSALQGEAQRVLQTDPANVPALMVQARSQAAGGEKAAAVKNYDRVLARFPDFAPAQKQLAALYLDDPNTRQKAYELASSARKTMSDDAELAGILGEATYYKKDYSRAAQLLQESNRKRPLKPTGLYFLGMSHLQAKQTQQGKETLEKAIAAGLPEPMAADAQKALEELEKK